VIGGLIGFTFYAWRKKYDYREIADMFGAGVPLGYTFGRLGNFANGELFGRITASPLGMIFPAGGISPASRQYAAIYEGAQSLGLAVPDYGQVLNLPRYPSQLYEALFEGVVLWAIIWFFRNRKPFKGFLAFLYIFGYGFFRFFLEYLRESDAGLGYRISLGGESNLPLALSHPLLSFSTGQILCLLMMLVSTLYLIVVARMPGREAVRSFPPDGSLNYLAFRGRAPEHSPPATHGTKKNRRKRR
jgi:phosphatidylglycerol:prolipoprotein diacylglycerol transferase